MHLNGFAACIQSNGERLREYQKTSTRDGRQITCWVATREEREFSVLLVLGDGQGTIRMKLYADGALLDCRIADGMHYVALSGNRVSSTLKRPYIFRGGIAPLEDTDAEIDDDSDMIDSSKWLKRGTITVELYRIKVQYAPLDGSGQSYVANESSLTTVRLGDATQSEKPAEEDVLEFEPMSPEDVAPFATFHFKHRTQLFLEEHGLAPSTLETQMERLSVKSNAVTDELLADFNNLSLFHDPDAELKIDDSTKSPP